MERQQGMARVYLSLCLLLSFGSQVTTARKSTPGKCLQEAQEKCMRELTIDGDDLHGGSSFITVEERCKDAGQEECEKYEGDDNASSNVLERNEETDDDDLVERAVEHCMKKMEKKAMMALFTKANMRGVCVMKVQGSKKVDERRRNNGRSPSGRMSPEAHQYLSSLGNPQGGRTVRRSTDSRLKRQINRLQMERGKASCLEKMKKDAMMMKTFTEAQMGSVCTKEITWIVKAQEARRRDPSMRCNGDRMSQPVKQYFNSLGKDDRTKRAIALSRPRKEYRMLTSAERQRYHNAVRALKTTMINSNTSQYDTFVLYHDPLESPGAHRGPAFLGWHREYLLRMERALQKHDPSIMIPYWDSTLDNNLGDLANRSIMWSKDFMGNVEGPVTFGPFANWKTFEENLLRGGESRTTEGRFYNDTIVDTIIGIDEFRNNTFHVEPLVEAAHDVVHNWVGGSMSVIETAPSDPIFYLHHAFVDLIWELQQQRIFKEGRRSEYFYPGPDDHEAYAVGENQIIPDIVINHPRESFHFITNPMCPFANLVNKDGLRDSYRSHYRYAPRPSCSRRRPTCGSPYLFCIDKLYKCAPKLQLGASCKGFESSDSCYGGTCKNGVCSRK